MKLRFRALLTLTVITYSVFQSACKKISIPEPNAKAIFGEWKYISSGGGFSGGQTSPSFGPDNWIEYLDNGKYQVYNKDKRIYKDKFKFVISRSIYSGVDETIIDYDSKTAQSFSVSNDTLFLFDQAYDAYIYTFVKK